MDEIDKKAYEGALKNFYANRPTTGNQQSNIGIEEKSQAASSISVPSINKMDQLDFEKRLTQNTDPDLSVGYEIVKFPSKGMFYSNGISEVVVEYMTSKDEDILSTHSLIENNTVFDILLKNKIKTQGIDVDDLLIGDKNAILLFLRASSYGKDYEVKVKDPRNGIYFNSKVDLTLLKHREIKEKPDHKMEYVFELPIRKKMVKFRMLTSKELETLLKTAQNKKEAYGTPYNEFNSLKLKSEIVEINGNRDKTYINKFVDAMPIKDSIELKKKIFEVTPDIDTTYTFKTSDGYEFDGYVSIGIDFFFPFN